MRLMFAYHIMALQSGTVGSAQQLYQFSRVARTLGHEVVIYGPPDPCSPFVFSLDVESADALICVFEWTSQLRRADQLDFLRLLSRIPKSRRVLIDCDGAYNERFCADGDCNHRETSASRRWTEVCDSLSDKVCQPTLHPLRGHVRPFLFYGFSPHSEWPAHAVEKEYGMTYIGHSKFRWNSMSRVLRAIEPVRERLGRIALVGHGWNALPPWAASMQMEAAFYTDDAYLRQLDIEFIPPIRFEQVIPWMSKAVLNPVLMRPTFELLRMVTPRLFETLSADTIPVFAMDSEHVREIYGAAATQLVLPADHPEEMILDIVSRQQHYLQFVERIRQELAENHSHVRRFRELLDIVHS